jgi:hypothetical protein
VRDANTASTASAKSRTRRAASATGGTRTARGGMAPSLQGQLRPIHLEVQLIEARLFEQAQDFRDICGRETHR